MPNTPDPTSSPPGPLIPHRGGPDGCDENCPHLSHYGQPDIVAISPQLQPLLAEWLEALDLELQYVPTPADMPERHYAAVIHPGSAASALLATPAVDGKIRPASTPRNRR